MTTKSGAIAPNGTKGGSEGLSQNVAAVNIYDYWHFLMLQFQRECEPDLITVADEFHVPEHSLIDVSEMVRDYIAKDREVRMIGYENETIIIQTTTQAEKPLFAVVHRRLGRATEKSNSNIEITVCSECKFAKDLIEHFDGKFRRKTGRIYWWYISKGGASSLSLSLPAGPAVHNEYYPFIKEGIYEYFKRYLDSSSPIMLMTGEPGTGKTTLLRSMLEHYNLRAYVGYDVSLFESDAMFIEFLSGSSDMIIIEDAETLLLPRKKNDNCMMSRFLNVSDGLIKFPRKKFVFTTNDCDFSNVDPALVRPGRCFDSLEFRKLDWNETVSAAQCAGITAPETEGAYTLAEIFNHAKTRATQKFGFN